MNKFYRYFSLILSLLFLISMNDFKEYYFYCERPYSKSNRIKWLNVQDFLRIISEIENAINKNPPTLEDYYKLVPDAYDDLEFALKDCMRTLNFTENKCLKFIEKQEKDLSKGISVRLFAIKRALTKDSNKRIKIFVDTNIHKCTTEAEIRISKDGFKSQAIACSIKIKAVAKIGSSEYKEIIFVLPCEEGGLKTFGKFYTIITNGERF